MNQTFIHRMEYGFKINHFWKEVGKLKYIFESRGRISGFSSQRINLSPFTKDFRGEEQINESNLYFSCPTT